MRKQILASLCVTLATGVAAFGQTPAPNKVGVIQVQAAIVSTKDGQKAVAELEAKMAPMKAVLEKKQTEIRTLQDNLQRGGNAMAEAAKADLARAIDQNTKTYQRDMQDAQAEFEDQQRKMLAELGQKMEQIIDQYAVANGYSVILDVSSPSTPVLYAANAVDITKDIIDLYDKASPKLPATSAPKPAAAPPGIAAPKPAAPKAAPSTAPPAVKKQP